MTTTGTPADDRASTPANTGPDREFVVVGQDQGSHFELWDIAPMPTDPQANAKRHEEIFVDALEALADVIYIDSPGLQEAVDRFTAYITAASDLPDYRVIRKDGGT